MADETFFSRDDDDDGAGAGFNKADVLERFLAKFIDFLIAGALYAFPSFVGPLAAITYMLISDGLKGGQSVGKRLVGFKVVIEPEDRRECDFRRSIIRNAHLGFLIVIYVIIGWIPYVGKVLAGLVWAAVIGMEMLLVYTDDKGSRFGDRIAQTRVIQEKK